MKGNFVQITPFMHVPDIGAALRFFEDVLGFKTLFRDGTYAYVRRETIGFRLLQNHGDDGAPPGNRRFCYYIDVRDVDALYAELKPKLDRLPPGDVHGPADKPYKQRELLVLAPDGNIIAFGHAITPAGDAESKSGEIRGLDPLDWSWVSALSAAHEEETSPLTRESFNRMVSESLVSWAYGDDEAYLIVFDQDSKYDSPNFLWFKERYSAFAYVDRIVVAPEARGRGIARRMYEQLFVDVYEAQVDKVVCEVNVDPPNPRSDAFHERLGFAEVGRATLANGKTVRYLKRDLP